MNPISRLLFAGAMAALACGALAQDKKAAPADKATAAEKGRGAAEVVRVTATVEAIDHKTRAVTLKDSKGEKHSFVVGPEARNLAQVAVGDVVTIAYGQAIAVKLDKTAKAVRERVVTEKLDRAPVGQKPGGVAVREVSVVASVEEIDPKKNLVTLRGPENTVTLKADPAMLKGVKKGDFVQAVYAEALAISVEKGPAAK